MLAVAQALAQATVAKPAADWRIAVACETARSSADVGLMLKSPFQSQFMEFGRLPAGQWDTFDAFVIDAWQRSAADLEMLSDLLSTLSHLGRPTFVIVGPSLRILLARRGLLAGINTCVRPLTPENLPDVLAGLLARTPMPSMLKSATHAAFVSLPEHREALIAADEALDRVFALATHGGPLPMQTIDRQTDTIIGSLRESGLGGWLTGVRMHHSLTYQHCLLVTGVAIAFGQHLGFTRRDLGRVAIGALLHDVGKARVPVGILDKPSALTPEERGLMTLHPGFGAALLEDDPAISPDILAVVRDHHEFLDGSGYPGGLTGGSISDFVRLITVADVFAALIEKRPYRQPMSGQDAYDILLSMNGQLDQAIVRAIRPIAFTALN
jgi:HD-GYP domain-containing protein (c-di-GMP phosphodiesterase class II)